MYFYQINAAVVSIRDFFLKHKKKTYWPQTFEQLCKLTDYLNIKQYIWMQGLFQKYNNSICKSFPFLIHSGFCSKSIHTVDEPKTKFTFLLHCGHDSYTQGITVFIDKAYKPHESLQLKIRFLYELHELI